MLVVVATVIRYWVAMLVVVTFLTGISVDEDRSLVLVVDGWSYTSEIIHFCNDEEYKVRVEMLQKLGTTLSVVTNPFLRQSLLEDGIGCRLSGVKVCCLL